MSNFALKYKSQQKDYISNLTQILLMNDNVRGLNGILVQYA